LKGDVQGSVEAVSESLNKLVTSEVRVATIHKGVGRITESDVDLAVASNAVIVGFNTVPDQSAKELAEKEKVDIKLYRIIYDLLEDVKKALVGMLEPKFKEISRGVATVKQVFKVSRIGAIAGCIVDEGEISIKDKVRLLRDGNVIYEGDLASLRRVKDDVSSVKAGTECGIKLVRFDDLKPGDKITTYKLEELKPILELQQ
jgi:translation initiation factor IF-2